MKMAEDEVNVATTLPHSSFGDPSCWGCLHGIVRGDQAEIVCNGCEALIATVPAADLQKTFDELELTLDVSSAVCLHSGAVKLIPVLSRILAFTCERCGRVAKLIDDPNIDRFFG
jgi:hypothetical protein